MTWASMRPLVLVDEAAEDRPAPDPLVGEVRDGVIGPRRAKPTAAMGAPPVVVPLVLGQDHPQMPSAEDQHPVVDLRADSEHEPFRITVAPHRQLHLIRAVGIAASG